MNRRDVLKAGVAAGLSALVPSWLLRRPDINLAAFCDPNAIRFNMAQPFVQESPGGLFKYATNGHVCLRVDTDWSQANRDAKHALPPACTLPWLHDDRAGWKKWPASDPITLDPEYCPDCDGRGRVGDDIEECPWCDGRGCHKCHESGTMGGTICQGCEGEPYGRFLGAQMIGDLPISFVLDRKVRQHLRDVEYHTDTLTFPNLEANSQAVMFRFDGGCGLLLPLDAGSVEGRLVKASIGGGS